MIQAVEELGDAGDSEKAKAIEKLIAVLKLIVEVKQATKGKGKRTKTGGSERLISME